MFKNLGRQNINVNFSNSNLRIKSNEIRTKDRGILPKPLMPMNNSYQDSNIRSRLSQFNSSATDNNSNWVKSRLQTRSVNQENCRPLVVKKDFRLSQTTSNQQQRPALQRLSGNVVTTKQPTIAIGETRLHKRSGDEEADEEENYGDDEISYHKKTRFLRGNTERLVAKRFDNTKKN